MNLSSVTAAALRGEPASREEALAMLTDEVDLTELSSAAAQVRRQFFGNKMKLNYLVNLKSGLCPEDCSYCSQAKTADTDVLKYKWLDKDTAAHAAAAGVAGGARRVCLVASGRKPTDRDVERVADIIGAIHEESPDVEVCACLGFLTEQQATRLHEAGADAYNHNLNTSEDHYSDICSTHDYADRVDTVEKARVGGLSPCSGLIAGMGETDEQLVDVVFALRELGVDSVPVNFLLPFEGTPFAGHRDLTPQRCLRILAMVRFVHPDTEVRAAAGREYHLRSLQPLAMLIANSIFLGDYLTSEGQAGAADLAMIQDLGLEIEGDEDGQLAAAAAAAMASHHGEAADGCGSCSSCPSVGTGSCHSEEEVPVRRRGVGTEEPANI
ncbi:MAG: biotin synthase BioB [Propionibacteriaceae bacterium]